MGNVALVIEGNPTKAPSVRGDDAIVLSIFNCHATGPSSDNRQWRALRLRLRPLINLMITDAIHQPVVLSSRRFKGPVHGNGQSLSCYFERVFIQELRHCHAGIRGMT